jgi:hypothetical protein
MKVMKIFTGILRTFILWDMFHRKAQIFHTIAACECSERNEIIHRDMNTFIS